MGWRALGLVGLLDNFGDCLGLGLSFLRQWCDVGRIAAGSHQGDNDVFFSSHLINSFSSLSN